MANGLHDDAQTRPDESSAGHVRPKVSVCTAWHNRANHISATIDSILAQDFEDFEFVIVNDGSKDPRVAEILDRCHDPRVKVIHQEQQGFTNAITRAIRESSGEYIAIMGAGDVCDPTRLRRQHDWMTAHPNCAIVGSYFRKLYVSENRSVDYRPSANPSGRIYGFTFSHGELMYRRNVYEAVGGYRAIFTVGQGSDLWTRMLRSHNSHVIPEYLYTQMIFDDGVSKSAEKLRLRSALDRLRIDNELIYRNSGVDLIERHGVHAPLFMHNNLVLRALKSIGRRIQLQIHQRPLRNSRK